MKANENTVATLSVKELQNIINELLNSHFRQSQSDEDIMDIDEVCRLTGLSKHTVYKKTYNHEIPFYRVTTAKRSPLRFRRSEIKAWIFKYRFGTIDEFCEQQDSSWKGL